MAKEITTEKLREWLNSYDEEPEDHWAIEALHDRLSSYDALKAEVESWTENDSGIRDAVGALPFETTREATERLKQVCDKAQTALAITRPLIEAVMEWDGSNPCPDGVLSAALAYRAALPASEEKA